MVIVIVVASPQEAMELRVVLPLRQKRDSKFNSDFLRLAYHH